jgi:hypothetical protein
MGRPLWGAGLADGHHDVAGQRDPGPGVARIARLSTSSTSRRRLNRAAAAVIPTPYVWWSQIVSRPPHTGGASHDSTDRFGHDRRG